MAVVYTDTISSAHGTHGLHVVPGMRSSSCACGRIKVLRTTSLIKQNRNQLLRAPTVGGRNSTRVHEESKGSSLVAIKMQGTNRSGVGGEKRLLCDPGSELQLVGGREKRRAKIVNRMGKKRQNKTLSLIHI